MQILAPSPQQSNTPARSKRTRGPRDDVADIKAAAAGRWAEIINSLTGISDDYLDPRRHGPCPKPGCGGDNRWRYTNHLDGGGAICNQCGKFGDGLAVIKWYTGWTFAEVVEKVGDYLKLTPGQRPKTNAPSMTVVRKSKSAEPKEFDADKRDRILERHAELLGLSERHAQDLRERGFPEEAILLNGFATSGGRDQYKADLFLCYEQPTRDHYHREVPGFRGIATPNVSGLVIPVRDRHGRRIANQIRLDDPKNGKKYVWQTGDVSPGSPIHHTDGCDVGCEVLGVTEGPLKGELASQKLGIPFVTVQGVGNWKSLCESIVEIDPRQVLVAFDLDWRTNPAVANALSGLVAWLREKQIEFAIATWPDAHKGIDDALAGGAMIEQVAERDAVGELLSRCAMKDGNEVSEASESVSTDGEPNETEPTEEPKQTEIKIAVDDPERLAKENLAYYHSLMRDIRYWRGQWWTYKGRKWEPQTETYIRARVREFVEIRFKEDAIERTEWFDRKVAKGEIDEEKTKRPEKQKVGTGLVRNVSEALQTLCLLPDHVETECFLPERARRNLWAVNNGLLDLDAIGLDPDSALLPHSSNWFSTHCHEYNFNASAECPTWMRFLDSVFMDRSTKQIDRESIDTLQRWFGYCLMPHVRLQKMLILDGVSRSGKGVIARILKRLVGEAFVASPKLRDFAGDFGLQPLLGKRLAVIGDAKLDRYRHDTESILETMLGVIGEDSMDVNVKRMDAATSRKLDVKFMLLCNSIPTLNDPAQAIVNRVVVLKFLNSFVGSEDTELTERLFAELDGIFFWSLLGYEKMNGDFRLPQPSSGQEAIDNFRRAVAPIRGFVDECCHLRDMDDASQPEFMTDRDDAYAAWIEYCHDAGRDHPGTRASFIRQLTNAFPSVVERRPGSEHRRYVLVNIELSEEGRKNVTAHREKRDGASVTTAGGADDGN